MKKKTFFSLLLLMLFAMVNLIQFVLASVQPADIRPLVREGELVALDADKEYRGQITGFYMDENSLFVLFGRNGIIKKYNPDGNYMASYAFAKGGRRAALIVDGDAFFLKDNEDNLYSLPSDSFGAYTPASSASAILEKSKTVADRQTTEYGTYYIKLVSIYRESFGDGTKAIVARPLYTVTGLPVYFVAVYWFIFLAGFAVILLPKIYENRGK